MASTKKRKRKQKVSFVRSEPPRASGNTNVIAFPSQAPGRASDPPPGRSSQPSALPSAQPRASMAPEPLPEAVHRTSIIQAEVADVVGDEVADAAPAPPAVGNTGTAAGRVEAGNSGRPAVAPSLPSPRAAIPGTVGLAEGSVDDEDTIVGADVPRAPAAPTRIGGPPLEYEDDVTSVDAQPLGSRRPSSAAPAPTSRTPSARPASQPGAAAGAGAAVAVTPAPVPAPGATDGGLYPEGEVTPVTSEAPSPAVGSEPDATVAVPDEPVHEHPHEDAFFSAAGDAHHADDEPLVPADGEDALPVGDRKAMWWTIGIAAGFTLAIGGYWTYQNLVLPEPVELGATEPAQLPDPSLLAEAEAVAPPEDDASGDVEAAAEQAPEDPPAEEGPADEEAIADSLTTAVDDPEALSVTPEELAAIVALPPEEVPPADASYDDLLNQGQAQEEQSNFEEAEALFRKALALEPQGSTALAHLGFIMLNRGETENARAVAEYAVALDPKSSTGWITLGAARQALSDYAGAREAYRLCAAEGEGKYVEECRRMMR